MEFFDLVFPQNVGPLTYRVPEPMRGDVVPGMLVSAEIRKSVKRAVVLRPQFKPPGGELKEIKSIESEGPVLSGPMLRTLEWMAEYYFSNEGLVLKSVLPREFFERVKARKSSSAVAEEQAAYVPGALDERALAALDEIRENVSKRHYKTFLYHAPSTGDELSFTLEAIRGCGNVIILAPEHTGMKYLEKALRDVAGDRLVLYHGAMSGGARTQAIEKILSGEGDVVLGSRMAVFAPLKEVSLIAVLHEENTAYKADSGVRYSARDMAVLRGFEESATVLLTSICPSVGSWHNAETGKYNLMEGVTSRLRPEVRVIDMRRSKSAISKKLQDAAASRIGKEQRAMFVINRGGYSMLRCGDCGEVISCKDCSVPLIYHKKDKSLRCTYCGAEARPPEVCLNCGGILEPAGAGVERVLEEMDSLNPFGVQTGAPLKVLTDTGEKLIVGSRGIARQEAASGGFSITGLLNADTYRYVPDFRATERAFKELIYLADKTAPGGQLFIQTLSPRDGLFSLARKFDFRGFYRRELSERKALGYPPYQRMVLLSATGTFLDAAGRGNFNDVEVLGPVPAMTKRGKRITKLLLKSSSRKALRSALKKILKGRPSREVAVDVDPIWV
jgi:primosomal protein N' (replication factor Y)